MEETYSEISEHFTPEEAVAWLRSVDGELYRTPPGTDRRRAWVAAVRTPSIGSERARLIIAIGDTALDAATAAASQWRCAWNQVPASH